MTKNSAKVVFTISDLPSDEKAKLKDAITRVANILAMIDAAKDDIKTIATDIKDTIGIEPKLLRNLAKFEYMGNYNEYLEQVERVQEFYENLVLKTNK